MDEKHTAKVADLIRALTRRRNGNGFASILGELYHPPSPNSTNCKTKIDGDTSLSRSYRMTQSGMVRLANIVEIVR